MEWCKCVISGFENNDLQKKVYTLYLDEKPLNADFENYDLPKKSSPTICTALYRRDVMEPALRLFPFCFCHSWLFLAASVATPGVD